MNIIKHFILTCLIMKVQSLLNMTDEFKFCSDEITKPINLNDFCFDKESCECMKLMTKSSDEFHLFKNKTNNYVVFYSTNNLLFEAECENVTDIILQDEIKSSRCFRDLFVAFTRKNNNFEPGFMTAQGILRKKTIQIECSSNPQTFVTPNKSLKVIKINNTISFWKKPFFSESIKE